MSGSLACVDNAFYRIAQDPERDSYSVCVYVCVCVCVCVRACVRACVRVYIIYSYAIL